MTDARDSLFEQITGLADKHDNVIVLSADMGAHGLTKFKEKHPDKFINTGVAEQNTINVAAGLTLGGKRVFVYGIAAFILQRSYEQVKLCLSDMQLPITIIGMGSGNYYWWDGATHCIEDIRLVSKTLNIDLYSINNYVAYKALDIIDWAYYGRDNHPPRPTYIGIWRAGD